jgi:uncharacterized membrane protein YdjX (TVP38/TMEM64 family)
VDALANPDTRAGVRRIRDRLLAEHLDLTTEAVAQGITRSGSLAAFIDSRQLCDRTLVRLELPPADETTATEAARLIADPEEPVAFGSTIEQLVPPADATSGLRPLPIPTGRMIVLAIALACLSSAVIWRPEFQTIQDALFTSQRLPAAAWIATSAIALGGVMFVPLEVLAIAAGALFDLSRGAVVALLGSLAAAAIGYAAGRWMRPAGLPRWMSRQSYRSARQLGARGVMGVLVLRLASVATSGSINLLCGAGRVPFATYMTGTLLALVPAVAALSGLGALLRRTILDPTTAHVLLTVGGAILLTAAATILRTLLLIRQFAPSVSDQRARAEFG